MTRMTVRRGVRGGFALVLTLTMGLGSARLSAAEGPVRIAYVDWSSSVASANLVCAVLRERLDRRCELIESTASGMWESVADGDADALLSAWLPDTYAHYLDVYGDRLKDIGSNLEGTRTGLVVPDVAPGRQTGRCGARSRPRDRIASIAGLAGHADALGGRIIGIDPEAGIMAATERGLDAYGLDDLRLVQGSEREMTEDLAHAIAGGRPIVVTGWQPHWMFGRWSLRFLDDPKKVYGGTGTIHTMVRPGLEIDDPGVYGVLDRFHWDPDARWITPGKRYRAEGGDKRDGRGVGCRNGQGMGRRSFLASVTWPPSGVREVMSNPAGRLGPVATARRHLERRLDTFVSRPASGLVLAPVDPRVG